VRQNIYGDTEYHIDEVLMAKSPINHLVEGKLQVFLQTCQECTVLDISKQNDTYCSPVTGNELNLEYLDLIIDTGHNRHKIRTVQNKDLPAARKFFSEIEKYIKEESTSKGKAWRDYYNGLNELGLCKKGKTLIHTLSYASVLTINMSQGSGYPYIFVDWKNIYGCQNYPHRLRLGYTALTRAKKHVFVLGKNDADHWIQETKTILETGSHDDILDRFFA
jgi:hypothetical protein